ncbi:MAG: uroporphyrinogen-III synthase [Ferrovibrio sp.]|uniref:uroporphyrinogen-III synthase n=1 Tax=Ferrovibrio sp. TaxID=1917215 RepID=UPI003918EB64
MRALITRPAAEAQSLQQKLQTRGIGSDCAPLLDIRIRNDAVLPLDGVTALLFTSVNGLRGFIANCNHRDLAVYAVGETTAAAARQAGFARVEAAGGDVEKLAALVRQRHRPQDGAMLHAAGATLAGDLQAMLQADGYDVRRVTLYAAEPAAALPAAVAADFAAGRYGAALFFSPRTAAVFVTLARQAGIGRGASACTALALSANVATALAPLGWAEIRVAAMPREGDMLALLHGITTNRSDGS